MTSKDPATFSGGKMLAAHYYQPYEELKLEMCSLPEPGENEVLIKVETCAVCHTDLQFIDRGLAIEGEAPLVLGHEIAGRIEKIGSAVKNWSLGERVIVPSTISCQHCQSCRDGNESQCKDIQMLGNTIDGGFAEFISVPAYHPVHLPSSITFETGSLIANVLTGAYHVIFDRANINPGDSVVIFGSGGFGLSILQMAKLRAAKVYMIDIFDWKLEVARQLGADGVLNSNKAKKCEDSVMNMIGIPADVVIETIGAPRTMVQAINILRKGGQMILSGYTDNQLPFLVGQIIMNEFSLIGTISAPRSAVKHVISLIQDHKIQTDSMISHRFPLSQVNEGLNTLRMGQSIRTVIFPQGVPENKMVSQQRTTR